MASFFCVWAGISSEGDYNNPALNGVAVGRSDNHNDALVVYVGAWLSLVERLVRDQEVGGSNPLAPTI